MGDFFGESAVAGVTASASGAGNGSAGGDGLWGSAAGWAAAAASSPTAPWDRFSSTPWNLGDAGAGTALGHGQPAARMAAGNDASSSSARAAFTAAALGMGELAGPGVGDPMDTANAAAGAARAGASPAEAEGGVPPEVLARAGLVFDHDGGYAYRITPDGNFEIVQAPEDRGLGYELTPDGEFASAWDTLSDYVVAMGPVPGAPGDAPQAPAPGSGRPRRPPKRGVPWGDKPGPGGPPRHGSDPGVPSDNPGKEPEAPPDETPKPPGGPDPGAPAGPAEGDRDLPHVVGGYASSREPGNRYPAYQGSATSKPPAGIVLDDGDEKLTPAILRALTHLGTYLPSGTRLTSGWRTDEQQADIIVDLAGGLVDGDLAKAYEKADAGYTVAWVGDSPHRPGLAFDLSGAPLDAIEQAVLACKADHPGDGISGTTLESSNNCLHVDVAG